MICFALQLLPRGEEHFHPFPECYEMHRCFWDCTLDSEFVEEGLPVGDHIVCDGCKEVGQCPNCGQHAEPELFGPSSCKGHVITKKYGNMRRHQTRACAGCGATYCLERIPLELLRSVLEL